MDMQDVLFRAHHRVCVLCGEPLAEVHSYNQYSFRAMHDLRVCDDCRQEGGELDVLGLDTILDDVFDGVDGDDGVEDY